ncbi:MAG: HU family DNA-binding protein [Treponematales bacterium]
MAVKLKKVSRKNPLTGEAKWYLTQETAGAATTGRIAKEIAEREALPLGDVKKALGGLAELLAGCLKRGESVKLDGVGSFRISVKSEGKAGTDQLSAHDVKEAKVVFLPSSSLKQSLAGISYEITG